MQLNPYILLFLVLFNSASTQVSFTGIIALGMSSGISVQSNGLFFHGTGKGLNVFDPLVMGYTTIMDITITSLPAGQVFGVGLGQRFVTATSCTLSNYPPSGQSWGTCTPSSTTCKTSTCMFNQVTAYTSSPYPAAYPLDVMQVNMKYRWEFIPPPCPSVGQCWQIKVSSPDDPLFTTKIFNPNFECSPAYTYTCGGTSIYAVYVEQETMGGLGILLQTTACTTIQSCQSCPDPSQCQYCFSSFTPTSDRTGCICANSAYYPVPAKTSCLPNCPTHSSLSGGSCSCFPTFVPSGDGCACPSGQVVSLDGKSCISSCPARSAAYSGYCYCNSPFTITGNSCLCSIGNYVDIAGSGCTSSCPAYSTPTGGICQCFSTFTASGNMCVCPSGQSISLDGLTCMSPCPTRSSDVSATCTCPSPFVVVGNTCVCGSGTVADISGIGCINSCPARSSASNGQCVCTSPFIPSSNTCICGSGEVIDFAGTGCLASCPAHSTTNSNGQCQCYLTFISSGNTCVCNTGQVIDVPGTACIGSCPTHSTADVNGKCQCDNTFIINGNSCACPIGKFIDIIGTSCIASCPSGSTPSSGGQCQCSAPLSPNGNGCKCAASSFLNVDASACVTFCPQYSLKIGEQCICNPTFIPNGANCICPGSQVVNLAGLQCISACPILSSPQSGRCQCNPYLIRSPDQASCICAGSFKLSLDQASCIDPCPPHSIVSNGACICDSANSFTLAPDKQSCQCKPTTFLDSTLTTCIPMCPTLTAPNNVPPYCILCHASCKTCSGPNNDECLSCYPNYELSAVSANKAVCNPTKSTSPTVQASSTLKAISGVGLAVSAATSRGNSGPLRVSLVGNMFQYLKFFNISYSPQLDEMLENLNAQFFPFDLGISTPATMTDESDYKPLQYQFTKYEGIYPSFLANYWDDLSMLVLVISIVALFVVLTFVVNKYFKSMPRLKHIFTTASLASQSFLLTFVYTGLGTIVFFGILDFRSAKSYSGVIVFNPIIAAGLLLVEFGILFIHFRLLKRYQKAKREAKELENFLRKHENVKALFDDFNDSSFLQQCYLWIAILRDMLCNFLTVMFFEYPLVESTFFMVFSWLMIFYIICTGPFKSLLNAIQQLLSEGILLVVNTCVFINAVMDRIGSQNQSTRDRLGSAVVILNLVFNIVILLFLAITLGQFLKEAFLYIKTARQKRNIVAPLKSEADSTNKTMITNSNYTMGEDLSPQRKSLRDDLETIGSARSKGHRILQEQISGRVEKDSINFDAQEQNLKTLGESPLILWEKFPNQQSQFQQREIFEEFRLSRNQKKVNVNRRLMNNEDDWGSQPQLQIDFSRNLSRDNSDIPLRNESKRKTIAEIAQPQDQRRTMNRDFESNASRKALGIETESPLRTSYLLRGAYTGGFRHHLDLSESFGMNSKQNSGLVELQLTKDQGTLEEIKGVQNRGKKIIKVRTRQRNLSQISRNNTQSNEGLEILDSFHNPINHEEISKDSIEIIKLKSSQEEQFIEKGSTVQKRLKIKAKRRGIPYENKSELNEATDFYQEKKDK